MISFGLCIVFYLFLLILDKLWPERRDGRIGLLIPRIFDRLARCESKKCGCQDFLRFDLLNIEWICMGCGQAFFLIYTPAFWKGSERERLYDKAIKLREGNFHVKT